MSVAHRDRLAGWTAEDRLLLECSRVEFDTAAGDRVAALLASPIDWEATVEASIRHGVAPLLKHGLEQLDALHAPGVPEDVVQALEALHAGSARRNCRLFAALGEITGAMRAAGADPVGLKDVQLAVDVYPDPALRPMGDIDLLIRREDWEAAAESLAELGFRPRPSADVPYTRGYAPAQHFRRERDEIWIDLQWNVMEREWDLYGEGRFTYDGLGMWQRAAPMAYDGYVLRVPSLEDMLFHLCVHLEGHMYSELVLFCDIAELLRAKRDELQWDVLLEIAREYRAQSSLYYVLLLTEYLLGAPVPAEVLEQLQPPYFHGALLEPVFANLTPLHLSLDEIRLAVAPPQQSMDELERVSRRQTARALRLDRELDQLARGFRAAGGKLIVFDGAPSLRVFPDQSLPAFEPIHAYVLAGDAPLLDSLTEPLRELLVITHDPVLAGETFGLTLTCERSSGLATLLSSDVPEDRTNARSALRSLRERLNGSTGDDRQATAHLVVHALTAEELIVTLAAKLGAAREHRLFTLCGMLEAVRGLDGDFDGNKVIELADALGVLDSVAAGLLLVAGLDGDKLPAALRIPRPTDRLRTLEWARYGPSAMSRYPWLRRAYYFAFVLLSAPGFRSKLRYLRRSMHARTGDREAVLPELMREIAGGVLRRRGASGASPQQLVHWLEPETASALAQRGRVPAG